MSEVTLTAEPRTATGSRPSNRLRRQGLIPGVVYGHGSDPRAVTVDRRDLRAALTTEAGHNALITLRVEGDELLTIVRDMQRNPVRNEVTHVDFILVSRDEDISVEVPITLEGIAVEVVNNDGTVDHVLFALQVNAKPGNIPNELVVDVSGMTIGDTIRVGDLPLPEGVTTDVDGEEPVVVAQITRATIEAEELEEELAEAAAEGEAAVEGEAGAEAGEGGEAQPDADDAE